MKTLTKIFLLVGVAFISLGFEPKTREPLLDQQAQLHALPAGLLAEFESNNGFSHYGKCLKLKIENKSNTKVDYTIPAGYQLQASDSNYQNLVVTENVFVSVLPKQKVVLPIFAMCTESHDAAPGSEVLTYKPLPQSNQNLSELCQLIAQEKWHNSEAQQAVWCLVEDRSLSRISGFDTAVVRKLQTKIAKLTNKKMPLAPAKTDYHRNYYATPSVIKIKVGGSYSFYFSRTKSVQIAMFNTQNVLVRELYKNEQEAPGRKTINYAFDASVYTEPVYYMRMFVDGEKRLETKMNLN
jgi:hypothetical protein